MINRTTIRKYLKLWQGESANFMKRDVFALCFRENVENGNKILNAILKDAKVQKKFKRVLSPNSLNDLGDVTIGVNITTQVDVLLNIVEKIIVLEYDKINFYIELKKEYERNLFSDNYTKCREVLFEIENIIGFSMWGCSQCILVEELENGLEANKKLLSRYTIEIEKNLLLNTLLDFYSYASEKNASYLNYRDKVNKYLDSLKDGIVTPYLKFKLDLKSVCDKETIGIVLQIDSQISIIDLYNSFVEILQCNSFHHFFDDSTILSTVCKLINDYKLTNIMVLENKYEIIEEYLSKNRRTYEIIEEYTVGNYQKVIDMADKYVNENPDDFQMRHFLAKSAINLGLELNNANIAVDEIYNIYSLNSKTNESFSNLNNMLKLYHGTTWKYKIRGFICRKQTALEECVDVFVSHISDCVITPNYVKYVQNKKDYLKKFHDYCPNTTELYFYLTGIRGTLDKSLSLDFIRKNVYTSTREIKDGNNEVAIQYLDTALDTVNKNDFYNMERIGRNLFAAYKNLRQWGKLIDLTVRLYMKNQNLCKRFKLEECINSIKKSKDENIRSSIKTPIFMYIYNKNDYKLQRIAYANYIDKNDINNVNDIYMNNISDRKEVVFFLSKICCLNVLKRDIRLAKNSDEVEIVRIDILRLLMNVDETNKKSYYDEINKIMLKRSIRDRIKQFNQSRIFVDTEKIGDEYFDLFKENYEKYRTLKSFEEKLSSLDITSEKYLEDLKKVMENMNTRLKNDVNYSQEVVVLKNLVSRITDEFLFNEKYGLNTFLSSRIRHGYCQNKLLTLFYDYHLTSKSLENVSSNYSVNEYWDEKVFVKDNLYNEFKGVLSEFTLKIDSKVDQIKKEWLRINNHESDKGLFDYREFVMNSVFVIINSEEISQDYEVFYKSIIDLFWVFTEKNLIVVREKIKYDLKNFFWESINTLEKDLLPFEKSILNYVYVEIKTNINICKTKIDNMIKEFSDVFYKMDVSYCDYKMQDLVVTCLQISQRLNSEFKSIQLNKLIQCDFMFSGESFPYFVDILNMMINNAIEHSGFNKSSDINLGITIKDKKRDSKKYIDVIEDKIPEKKFKNYVVLSVKNNLDTSIDEKQLTEKIANIFSNAKNPDILREYTQSEGGSGLYKIYKTLQYNIMAPYSILYNVEEENFELIILIEIDDLIIL